MNPSVAYLRIAWADQDEPRWVTDADAFALNCVPARSLVSFRHWWRKKMVELPQSRVTHQQGDHPVSWLHRHKGYLCWPAGWNPSAWVFIKKLPSLPLPINLVQTPSCPLLRRISVRFNRWDFKLPVKAFSMSIVPQTRSSVAPRGRSTMLIGTLLVSRVPLTSLS